jgi:hypothetical protein
VKRSALILALALVAGSLLSTGAASYREPQATGAAARAACLKIWHQKRAVKWVKRRGRWRKVAYWKRWWTCDPYEAPGPSRLGVEAKEFSFGLSRPEVRAGRVIIQLNNRGEDTHNLRLAVLRTNRSIGAIPDTGSRRVRSGSFALAPGFYSLTCTLFRHSSLGMRATLRVLPAG